MPSKNSKSWNSRNAQSRYPTAPIPSHFWCRHDGKWESAASFSDAQIAKYRQARSRNPNVTVQEVGMVCKMHAAPADAIKCAGPCGLILYKQYFSKSQRNRPDAWCIQCTNFRGSFEGDEKPGPPPNSELSPHELADIHSAGFDNVRSASSSRDSDSDSGSDESDFGSFEDGISSYKSRHTATDHGDDDSDEDFDDNKLSWKSLRAFNGLTLKSTRDGSRKGACESSGHNSDDESDASTVRGQSKAVTAANTGAQMTRSSGWKTSDPKSGKDKGSNSHNTTTDASRKSTSSTRPSNNTSQRESRSLNWVPERVTNSGWAKLPTRKEFTAPGIQAGLPVPVVAGAQHGAGWDSDSEDDYY